MTSSGPIREAARHIPWGYGKNRLSAMPVDPERLYAYWEITDLALESGRTVLGEEGPEARLVLRVHDVTGLIFDGTNAHAHVDVELDRAARQWFLDIRRPGSAAVVEVGLAGPRGGYAPLARSRRVEFPRRDPAPPAEPAWVVVREVADGVREASGPRFRVEPVGPSGAPAAPALDPGPGPGSSEGPRGDAQASSRSGASEERLRGRTG